MKKTIKKNKIKYSSFFKHWTKNIGVAPCEELINICFALNKIEDGGNLVSKILHNEHVGEWDFSDTSYESGIRYYQKAA